MGVFFADAWKMGWSTDRRSLLGVGSEEVLTEASCRCFLNFFGMGSPRPTKKGHPREPGNRIMGFGGCGLVVSQGDSPTMSSLLFSSPSSVKRCLLQFEFCVG